MSVYIVHLGKKYRSKETITMLAVLEAGSVGHREMYLDEDLYQLSIRIRPRETEDLTSSSTNTKVSSRWTLLSPRFLLARPLASSVITGVGLMENRTRLDLVSRVRGLDPAAKMGTVECKLPVQRRKKMLDES